MAMFLISKSPFLKGKFSDNPEISLLKGLPFGNQKQQQPEAPPEDAFRTVA